MGAAAATLLGIITSGPLAMLVIDRFHPQPSWESAELFARSYHPLQTLPYFAGFLLVGGSVALVVSAHLGAPSRARGFTTCALVSAAVFAALVSLNYVNQTTFVPALARSYHPESAPLLSALTMSHPGSLAWALEMWGYAFLGAATWLTAPAFARDRLERAAAWLFAANGPASIGPALLTALLPGWEMSPWGVTGFAFWNVLMVAMSVVAWAVFRRRLERNREAPPARFMLEREA